MQQLALALDATTGMYVRNQAAVGAVAHETVEGSKQSANHTLKP